MRHDQSEALYQQVIDDVYACVKYLDRGILYQSIHLLLRSETSEFKQQIYDEFDIQPDSSRSRDLRILSQWTRAIENLYSTIKQSQIKNLAGIGEQFEEFISGFSDSVKGVLQPEKLEEKKMEEVKWIIVGACTLVGVGFCIKYFNDNEQRKRVQRSSARRAPEQGQAVPVRRPPPIPGALCLVVPAQVASSLRIGDRLHPEDIADLIDNASFFLCSTLTTASQNEQGLVLTEDPISPNSQREVYLKIFIDEGRNLIDKKIPYSLKTSLSPNTEFVIAQIACLRNLSGLEVFNRI